MLFLREDIYDVLAKHDEDLPKRNYLRMEWSAANLAHLVAQRISAGVHEEVNDDGEAWMAIFEPTVKGLPTADYILSHSLPRPRDVLDFCQKAIDQAQRNGHPLVTEQDVLDAERDFSESLFRSVALEFRALYPSLDEVLMEFGGAPVMMSWAEFERLAGEALKKHARLVTTWYGAGSDSAEYLASVLFKVGVIGFSRAGSSEARFANGKSFAETWHLVSPAPDVVAHPAFIHVLDISPRLSPGARPRTVRQADPRQIRMTLPEEEP